MSIFIPWIVIAISLGVLVGYPIYLNIRYAKMTAGKLYSHMPPKVPSTQRNFNDWMPVVVTVLVLLSSLFIVLANEAYPESHQKWAFGSIGTIIGYWFKKP